MAINNRLPLWFRQELPDGRALKVSRLLSEFGAHTVCQEARCPNITGCFNEARCTFIILGNRCSRNCGFCAVDKSGGAILPLDTDEPYRIRRLARLLKLDYAVVTSVSRDDLADGGASIFAQTIKLLREIDVKTEALIPDFQGKIASLQSVLQASPVVVAHNIETIKRLYPALRPEASYELSLGILKKLKELGQSITTKSSIMLGLGEREEEVVDTMKSLKESCCDILTLGQYLAPSARHYPMREFISLEKFQEYKNIGLDLGFKAVLSGPCVRSSYRAQELYHESSYA